MTFLPNPNRTAAAIVGFTLLCFAAAFTLHGASPTRLPLSQLSGASGGPWVVVSLPSAPWLSFAQLDTTTLEIATVNGQTVLRAKAPAPAPTLVRDEIPTRDAPDARTFTLSRTPSEVHDVYLNGLHQLAGSDYMLSANTLTFTSEIPSDSLVNVTYAY